MKKATTTFDFEFRSSPNDDEMIVEGYALKFDKPTLLYDFGDSKVYEQIERGALKKTDIKDVVLNKNHDDNLLLARTINKSLELIVDDIGLKIRAKLPNTQMGRDVFEEIRSGLLNKMSFRWTGGERSVDHHEDGNRLVRWTMLGKLYDVSAVAFPAYDDTSISEMRKLVEQPLKKEKKESIELKYSIMKGKYGI